MIDAHHHLWDPDARTYAWLDGGQPWASDEELSRLRRPFTLSHLTALAASAGVTATVVIQTVSDEWETGDLLAMAAGMDPYVGSTPVAGENSGVLAGVVGWVDLTAPDVEEAVARVRSQPGGSFLRGVRHPLVSELDPQWLCRTDVRTGLHALAGAGLCFDVIALPRHLEAVVAAAEALPELAFVLEHMGGPPLDRGHEDDIWTSAICRLGSLANVTCKLSGVHSSRALVATLRPYYESLLEAFGPERLMYGSDWPVSSLAATYDEVYAMYRELTADLTLGEHDAIFERTARRVYGLDHKPSPEAAGSTQ